MKVGVAGILAPAYIKADVLMPVKKIITPSDSTLLLELTWDTVKANWTELSTGRTLEPIPPHLIAGQDIRTQFRRVRFMTPTPLGGCSALLTEINTESKDVSTISFGGRHYLTNTS